MKKIISFFIIVIFTSCKSSDIKTENKKANWITDAFDAIESGNYPNIKAISWWHENWEGTKLRLDSSKEATETYKERIANNLYETELIFENNKLIPNPDGIYHSAFPDFGGQENFVSDEKIIAFEDLVEKEIAWAYFSNNWIGGIFFPIDDVQIIHNTGKTPFIRLMARSDFQEYGQDETYTMERIIQGDFDAELNTWFIQAANLGYPILCEFGTEVNGNWFPWNGQYSGAGITDAYGDANYPDGSERFRDAYRHIIDIANLNNANNITWFFHIDVNGEPDMNWNTINYYYPGDNYIDWLGFSAYGPYDTNAEMEYFSELVEQVYPKLQEISTEKPIAVLEFGVTEL